MSDPLEPRQDHAAGPHEHGHSIYEAGEFLDAPPEEAIPEREVSLARRLLNLRTIGSIAFGLLLVFLLFRVILNVDFGRTFELMRSANVLLLLAGLVAYYLTFPLRSLRWTLILRRVGSPVPYRAAMEILFLSWFVNCIVPAKLGDLYRAYLLRGNYGASISRTVGTIFIERVTDILVIFALALAAGFWSFRGRNRPEVDALFFAGFIVAAVLLLLVVALRYQGRRLTRFLPERAQELYERFHEGSTGALTPRVLLPVGAITVAVWLLEGARVFFVHPGAQHHGFAAGDQLVCLRGARCVSAHGCPPHACGNRVRAGGYRPRPRHLRCEPRSRHRGGAHGLRACNALRHRHRGGPLRLLADGAARPWREPSERVCDRGRLSSAGRRT